MERTVKIIGGGIAGLTLGILLRRQDLPVELWEAGTYPRHKVCGEYVSGRGVDLLRRWDILQHLPHRESREVRFFFNGQPTGIMRLPQPALSISRYHLDFCLAKMFQELGGTIRLGARWIKGFSSEGLVRATGRRLERSVARPLVGLKIHARNLSINTGLELHFSDAGYAGLCQLADGAVNVCGLFKTISDAKNLKDNPRTAFGPFLGNLLENAEIDPASFSSVAGIATVPARWEKDGEFRLGDCISVIPPLTGNGMSLAMESASLAAVPLAKYGRGQRSWPQALDEYNRACREAFAGRLRFSSFLQRLLFDKRAGKLLFPCLKNTPGIFPILFRLTR